MEEHLSHCFDDAGNIGAVIRHNGLRRLLLGQGEFPSRFLGVQGHFFQFQFHEGLLPFPAIHKIHVLVYEPPGKDMSHTLKIFFRMPRSILGDFQTTMFIRRLLSVP